MSVVLVSLRLLSRYVCDDRMRDLANDEKVEHQRTQKEHDKLKTQVSHSASSLERLEGQYSSLQDAMAELQEQVCRTITPLLPCYVLNKGLTTDCSKIKISFLDIIY